ncbi:MAG: glucose-1-phosphate thymidylyltransferase [Bacteroidetes bacterium SW_11_45_7]|nr:MAG: glucose-1-phosphate thymidylyltransferase [Bacteroidetes bacterium SW_11_45_7]
MANYQTLVLFDDADRDLLLPLTYTRPVADLRIGIRTIREKWEQVCQLPSSTWTEPYLASCFPCRAEGTTLLINGAVLPDEKLVEAIQNMQEGQALVNENFPIAFVTSSLEDVHTIEQLLQTCNQQEYKADILSIRYLWDIYLANGKATQWDFDKITGGRQSAKLSSTNTVIGDYPVFLEEGAKAECSTFNTTKGPVYLGTDAEVMEGAMIRGPFTMLNHATVKMGTKIYGPTTLGPYCKAGGEVNNSILTAYSNKAHDGFLGNSVIGEWCNIGADTNNSNLKNDYGNVKMWSYRHEQFTYTGQQFVGLMMGDHAKCGINTMFNTGTVVGVSANVFGGGFPLQFIPSFAWGGPHGFSTYMFDKACEVAERMKNRRGLDVSADERNLLAHIFNLSEKYRHF